MRILFVHQNFPGQFKHLAAALASDPAHEVVAMSMNASVGIAGVRLVQYQASRGTSSTVHPWVAEFETKVIRGEAAFLAALKLREEGFYPEVIIAHPGWGESLFLKEVWATARLGMYCEFYYHPNGADVGFDPEFPPEDVGAACRLHVKNVNNLMHFQVADAGISPTQWQASTFPDVFRSKISVIHDGIDTDAVTPNADVSLTLNDSLRLTRSDEIITFVNRNLEPYRGYHVFMRALPHILKARPKARVLIVGGDGVSYGARAPDGKTWKQIYLDEVGKDLDLSRVHFLGRIPYAQFVPLLQISTVHVYLTYPFVLSWSLLEAMSAGCAIVASDTAPLKEAITHGENGYLINFFDVQELTASVLDLFDAPQTRARMGKAAREFAITHYDLQRICLPRQLEWVKRVADL